jgi:hypothetical protein
LPDDFLVAPETPLLIVVSGGFVGGFVVGFVVGLVGVTVLTVKERVAGVSSVLPAGSLARTEKLWAPSASAVDV